MQVTEQPTTALARELRQMLSQTTWNTSDGLYLRGEYVSALIYPRQVGDSTHTVYVTVAPVSERRALLSGSTVVFYPASGDGALPARWGYLNDRGQARFLGVEAGAYRATITPARSSQTHGHSAADMPEAAYVFPLSLGAYMARTSPGFPVAAQFVAGGGDVSMPFANADGSLECRIMETGVGGTHLRVRSMDPDLDGSLLRFVWTDADAESDLTAPVPAHEVYVPLARMSQEEGAPCVAETALGRVAHRLDTARLAFPERIDAEAYGRLDIGILRRSVLSSATPDTRSAWRRLARRAEFGAPAREAIEEALRV